MPTRHRVCGRKVWHSVLILVSTVLFFACINDTNGSKTSGDGEDAWVFVTVSLPQPALPASRATDLELEISNIRIMVFEPDGDTYRFSYQVAGNDITPTDSGGKFKARLKTTESPVKLVILINAEEPLASYEPSEGTAETDIRKEIVIPFPAGGLSDNLPMCGETILPNGIGIDDNYITMNALRAIARVDVEKQLDEGSGDFILEEVQVFRAYSTIQLIPDNLTDPAAPIVTAPSIPANAVFLDQPVGKSVVGGTDAITQIYLPESHAAGGNISERDGTAVVVVGGRFAGSNQTTYYRADFDPGVEGHPFGQVLRNHRYTFVIKKVTAAGWSTPLEAANNFATSLVVKISAWEDFSSEMFFGENRFAVSAHEISLPYIDNRHGRIDIESTLPYTIQWLDANGNPTGASTAAQDTDVGNSNFKARIIKQSGDPETVSHVRFQTLNNNATGSAVITNTLRVTVDNWAVDITVRQDNRAVYSGFFVNVTSARPNSYYVGNLGTTMVYPIYDPAWTFVDGGLGMRMILDKQFCPGGVIKIAGFRYDEITEGSVVLMNITDDSHLDLIARFLETQDVLFLTYAVKESTQVAQVVLDWLNKSTKRVLILCTDNATTNANVVSLLTADATWKFNNLLDDLLIAPATDQNRLFLSGPFGAVTSGAKVTKKDEIAGHTQTYSADIIPLIVSSTNSAIIYFGVNKKRRIVYNGDANLYHIDQLSNHLGNVTSNTDRLMANVWAWIVDQVIYGDDEI